MHDYVFKSSWILGLDSGTFGQKMIKKTIYTLTWICKNEVFRNDEMFVYIPFDTLAYLKLYSGDFNRFLRPERS